MKVKVKEACLPIVSLIGQPWLTEFNWSSPDWQCDQMVTLVIQYLAIYNNEHLPQ